MLSVSKKLKAIHWESLLYMGNVAMFKFDAILTELEHSCNSCH